MSIRIGIVLSLLSLHINLFCMEITFLKPITITYKKDVPKKDKLFLNEEETAFLNGKILLWKSTADKWKELLPQSIYKIINLIPSVPILQADAEVVHYKNIVEKTYSFSPNKIKHLSSKGLIVSEEIFRQKLLYLEALLYNNTSFSNENCTDFMIQRFNNSSTDTDVECDRIQDFLFRHQNCDFDKAKIIAAIFLLYLP